LLLQAGSLDLDGDGDLDGYACRPQNGIVTVFVHLFLLNSDEVSMKEALNLSESALSELEVRVLFNKSLIEEVIRSHRI
jgi:hypothetical protein